MDQIFPERSWVAFHQGFICGRMWVSKQSGQIPWLKEPLERSLISGSSGEKNDIGGHKDWGFPDLAAQFQPVHLGHNPIDDRQLRGILPLHGFPCFLTIRSHHDLVFPPS
jgi:hypothetical protein